MISASRCSSTGSGGCRSIVYTFRWSETPELVSAQDSALSPRVSMLRPQLDWVNFNRGIP